MSRTVVFESQQEIAALKRRIEQLERIVDEIRNPPVYGGYPKWFHPAEAGGPYWLGAPQAGVAH